MPLSDAKIVLAVSAGIAAYKMPNLASSLVKKGADLHCIMTANAAQFVTAEALAVSSKHPCLSSVFGPSGQGEIRHIELAASAQLFVVCPATADIIAKLAAGIADDLIGATALAATCPKLLFPSMNTKMFDNPATQANLRLLAERGWYIAEPDSGMLACGIEGKGRLPDETVIVAYIEQVLLRTGEADTAEAELKAALKNLRITVTAGPTRERIDAVRFISNPSSGKMGYAIAAAAAKLGAEVKLISGPVAISVPADVAADQVETAEEMCAAVLAALPDTDILIMAAAVADFTPVEVFDGKIKKDSVSDDDNVIRLKRTEDILKKLSTNKPEQLFVCGFSMETENLLENSRRKLVDKKLDLICANNLHEPGAGFAHDTNRLSLISAAAVKDLPLQSKSMLAVEILREIALLRQQKN